MMDEASLLSLQLHLGNIGQPIDGIVPGQLAGLEGLIDRLDNLLVLLEGLGPLGLLDRVGVGELMEDGLELGLAEAVQWVQVGRGAGQVAGKKKGRRYETLVYK